jgi:hypothetical protein
MASLFTNRDYTDTMNSPIRELKLSIKDPKARDGATGLVDTTLLKGDNKLFTIMDEYGNWYFKYKHGILPEGLLGKFTSASKSINHAKSYFARRNLEVTEVKDVHAS